LAALQRVMIGSNSQHKKQIRLLFRELPSVDELLRLLAAAAPSRPLDHVLATSVVRRELQAVRLEVAAGKHDSSSLTARIQALAEVLGPKIENGHSYSLLPVINATGVILHTNLGRAPLSERALQHIQETAGGYCNLEFELDSGRRGRRERLAQNSFFSVVAQYSAVSLADLTEKYGLFVANNCAAATFLTLHSLAAGGEVVVSRGELVEIGGGFRIPEILEKAGATLREVGTTNKTRLADYESAIGERTKLILRVHRSNFRMTGFTERPDLSELVELGRRRNIPVFEDQGTGALPLSSPNLRGEPTLIDSVNARVDIIACSGDKLLGGPQAGLIIGRRELIEIVSRNPLARAFRVDKLTYAALDATLLDYAAGKSSEIPIIGMINRSAEDIRRRAEALTATLDHNELTVSIAPGHSVIGGGTTPGKRLRTFLIRLAHKSVSASILMKMLRESRPPVIARVADDWVLFDLRTVPPEFDALLAERINQISAGHASSNNGR
jgi:L-seryl-tRNA(Ser) seleniumtransferase